MARWSPVSMSAAPRPRSSSPTAGSASSTSTSRRPTGHRWSARLPVSSTTPDASFGRISPRSAWPSRATSTRTDGSVSMAVNLGITHLMLGPLLQAELGVPTFVEHDARAAAVWLSEQAADGSAETPTSVAFLAIGTGISAGVILDGALLRGDNSYAGEVGHVVADPDGAVCACGLRGCLETIAAGPAIARQADEATGCRSQHRPVAAFGCRRCLPRRFRRRSGRGRDHRPSGRPPGPSHPIARPDPRHQTGCHRRRRGGRWTCPARTRSNRASLANARPRHWPRPPWAM